MCYSHSCIKGNGRKAIPLSCGLGYKRRSKLNRALIAGMDPENPAAEVKQFRPSKKRKKSASAVTHARKKAAQKARATFLSRRGLSSLGPPRKGKNLQACCGLRYERRSKTNIALIAGMDPENPATEVEQLRLYARMRSILEDIYENRVLRVDGSKSCCTLYLYNVQIQIVIKKSQDIIFRFLR